MRIIWVALCFIKYLDMAEDRLDNIIRMRDKFLGFTCMSQFCRNVEKAKLIIEERNKILREICESSGIYYTENNGWLVWRVSNEMGGQDVVLSDSKMKGLAKIKEFEDGLGKEYYEKIMMELECVSKSDLIQNL